MERKPSSPADKRFLVLMAFQCLIGVALASLIVLGRGRADSGRASLLRDTAAKLQAAGLTNEAIAQYEEYLREPGIAPATRASLSYSLGQMYESEGRPERALAWYYQVEGSDPGSPERKDAEKRIVALLESLGRHQAAKSVLSGATALGGTEAAKTGKPVAQVGDKVITLEEVDAAMDALPPQLKPLFEGTSGKQKFVKKYVADELLYEKAKRQQYDTDPKWLKELDQIKRQFLVGRVLNEEVLGKINVDEKDLRNYFEANKARYAQGKKVPAFEKIKKAVEQDYRSEKGQAKYQELVDQLVAGDNVKLYLENVK